MIKLVLQKPDTLGTIASILCIIHCLVTPILIVAHTFYVGSFEISSNWWSNLDYVFLIISFLAMSRSLKTTTSNFVKIGLSISWLVLCLLIMNEKIEFLQIPEIFTYTAALSLAGLHMYNMKYCQCKTDKCCTENE